MKVVPTGPSKTRAPVAADGKPRRYATAAGRGNRRALRTGAQADGRNLPGFEETRKEVPGGHRRRDLASTSDLLVLDLFTRELHTYRHANDALARLGDTALLKKVNAQKLQVRRAKVLGELAGRMGFTAESRYRLGLTVTRTERERVRVVPVRSEERAQKVAELLARSGAIPRVVDAEVVHADPKEKT